MKRLVFCVTALFLGQEAHAGHCRQQVIAQVAHHHQAAIVAPVVAVPVLAAPIVGYQQTYYQVGYVARDEARDAQLVERIVQRLVGQAQQAPAYTQPTPAPQRYTQPAPQKFTQSETQPCPCIPNPALTPTPAPPQPDLPPTQAGAMTVKESKVQAVFANSCVKCHNGTQADRVNLTNVQDQKTKDARCAILAQVYSGKMPKGGQALDDQAVAAILDWMVEVENNK